MDVKFKVGGVHCDPERGGSLAAIGRMTNVLRDLCYMGQTQVRNSTQLNIGFDEALVSKLRATGWECHESPYLETAALGDDYGRLSADAVISSGQDSSFRIVLEIEKANKKTVWIDFIKLWMFIEADQAHHGVLVAPVNYAHRHGIWNVFQEARLYKSYLGRFAQVPAHKLSLISIVGYEQLVQWEGAWVPWDADVFNRVKLVAQESSR